MTRKLAIYLYYFFKPFVVFILSRRSMRKITRAINRILLESLGIGFYSNNFRYSGELQIVRKMSNLGQGYFVDIGASVGDFCKLVLEETDCKILAFEPMKSSFHHLQILASKENRLSVYNYAIGDRNSLQDIFWGSETSQHATLAESVLQIEYLENSNLKSEKVEVKTLDSAITEIEQSTLDDYFRIDFVKIDTEGYELEVLKGSVKTLEVHKPKALILEFNEHHLYRGHSLLDFKSFLAGYSCFRITPFGGVFEIDPKNSIENIPMYSNLVYVRRDLVDAFIRS